MRTVNNTFFVNGVDLSSYVQEINPSYEYVWADGSGRTQSAKWTGDIVGIKWTLNVTIKPTTEDEMVYFLNALDKSGLKANDKVKFINPKTKTLIEITTYKAPRKFKPYNYATRDFQYESATFDFIEV